jgi:hypothetical protein
MSKLSKQLASSLSWQSLIFNTEDLIGYSKKSFISYDEADNLYYILNPLKQQIYGAGAASSDNIACYKNILIEFDHEGWSVKRQLSYVKKLRLPFAMATFSGGKSVHFVISLLDEISTREEYARLCKILQKAMKADERCVNVNRLTRKPFAEREPGKVQALLAMGRKITLAELYAWMECGPARHKIEKVRKAEIERAQAELAASKLAEPSVSERLPIPRIYVDMLEHGTLHPEHGSSRHDSLRSLGLWLTHKGYREDMPELVRQAAESLGIGGRVEEVERLISWCFQTR